MRASFEPLNAAVMRYKETLRVKLTLARTEDDRANASVALKGFRRLVREIEGRLADEESRIEHLANRYDSDDPVSEDGVRRKYAAPAGGAGKRARRTKAGV